MSNRPYNAATNKRLLLAAHYGQFRRKMELTNYQALLVQLKTTNATRAGTILDDAESAENSTAGPDSYSSCSPLYRSIAPSLHRHFIAHARHSRHSA
jgi:hypothetical protein